MAGGSYIDVCEVGGVSKTAFYDYAHRCIAAINACDDLKYVFPPTPHQIAQAAAGFQAKSTNNVHTGCVAAVDGLLLKIITPPSTQVANVKSFFSGHYKSYGVNVQAVCDSNCSYALHLVVLTTLLRTGTVPFQSWYKLCHHGVTLWVTMRIFVTNTC